MENVAYLGYAISLYLYIEFSLSLRYRYRAASYTSLFKKSAVYQQEKELYTICRSDMTPAACCKILKCNIGHIDPSVSPEEDIKVIEAMNRTLASSAFQDKWQQHRIQIAILLMFISNHSIGASLLYFIRHELPHTTGKLMD